MATGEFCFPPVDIDLFVITRFYDPTIYFSFERIKRDLARMFGERLEVSLGQYSLRTFNVSQTIDVVETKERGIWIFKTDRIKMNCDTSRVYMYMALQILVTSAVVKPLASLDVRRLNVREDEEAEPIIYACAKAYLGMVACLLIMRRRFRCGHEERINVFRKTFTVDYPQLYARIPFLLEKALWALKIKTGQADRNAYAWTYAVAEWFRVRNYVREILSTVIESCGHEQYDTDTDMSTLYHVRHNLLNSLMYGTRLYAEFGMIPPLRSLFVEPVNLVHAACLCLFNSINYDGLSIRVDSYNVQCAEKNIRRIFPINIRGADWIQKWDNLRAIAVALNDRVASQLQDPPDRTDRLSC